MGYYSNFEISIDSIDQETVMEKICEIAGYNFDDNFGEIYEATWYDCIPNIETVSKLFPSTLITVKRTGEDQGDIEMIYAINGSVFTGKAKIHYPSFEECKAKSWKEEFKI